MKKIISAAVVFAALFIFASCGGGAETTLIGSWKIDPASLDVELGDGFPAEMKTMVENGKKEMREEGSAEMDKVTIEFKEGGKFVMSAEGEDEKIEGTWSVDGEKLKIEAEIEGKKGSVSLNLDEVSSDKVALSLSAEDLLAEIKKQMPEALEEVPPMFDIDAMVKGTKFMVSLKK